MLVIDDVAPDWRRMRIHESSPIERGTSVRLRKECAAYVGTQIFPGIRPGSMHEGFRCEDLEQQTFGDRSFDLVITQDVMEHVLDPRAAYREIWRTLAPGGMHIHTTPIIKNRVESVRRAARRARRRRFSTAPVARGLPRQPRRFFRRARHLRLGAGFAKADCRVGHIRR